MMVDVAFASVALSATAPSAARTHGAITRATRTTQARALLGIILFRACAWCLCRVSDLSVCMTPSFFNIIVVCHVQRRRDQRGMIARSSICLIVTAAAALAARRSHGARTAPLSAAFATQLRFARMRIAERDQYINATAGRKNGLASRSLASWYGGMVLSPSFACPVDLVKALSDRQRAQARATNHTADGGKWLCGLSLLGALGEPCLVYSMGSNMDTDLEEFVEDRVVTAAHALPLPSRPAMSTSMASRTEDHGAARPRARPAAAVPTGPRPGARCQTHIYDPTIGAFHGAAKLRRFEGFLAAKGWSLHQVALYAGADDKAVGAMPARGPTATTSTSRRTVRLSGKHGTSADYAAMTLAEMLAANGHAGQCVDVLKIDVEGAEEEVLARVDWSASTLCVGLLLIELHADVIERNENGRPYTIGRALARVRALEAAGFLHYGSEVVCGVCHGQVELAFVNASWLGGLIARAEESGVAPSD